METFIGFFDILGFKEIVKNNEAEKLDQYFKNLMRDTQSALSEGKYVDGPPGVILPDLSRFKVNCLHISDSIVFWIESDSLDDFNNLIEVCGNFYRTSLQLSLPIRGCLTYGEIEFRPFSIKKSKKCSRRRRGTTSMLL